MAIGTTNCRHFVGMMTSFRLGIKLAHEAFRRAACLTSMPQCPISTTLTRKTTQSPRFSPVCCQKFCCATWPTSTLWCASHRLSFWHSLSMSDLSRLCPSLPSPRTPSGRGVCRLARSSPPTAFATTRPTPSSRTSTRTCASSTRLFRSDLPFLHVFLRFPLAKSCLLVTWQALSRSSSTIWPRTSTRSSIASPTECFILSPNALSRHCAHVFASSV